MLEEAIYHPRHKNVNMDFTRAINRKCVPDTSNEPTRQQQVPLAKTPLRVAGPVLDPALRTDVAALRDIAACAKSFFPKIGHYHGTLRIIHQSQYSKVPYELYIAPHLQGHYDMDVGFLDWKNLFDSVVLKNYSINGLQLKNEEYDADLQARCTIQS